MATTPQPSSTTSLADLLTAVKNLVQALNGATTAFNNVNGVSTTENITTPTLIKGSPGRVATISVIVAGTTPGMLYDSATLNVTSAPLVVVPNIVGAFFVNLPTDTGLVVVPGNGQTLMVSWS